MYSIWNHKENWIANSGFKTIEDAWAHVRAFYNTSDYEVRLQSPNRPFEKQAKRKKKPKKPGRPSLASLGIKPRVRHNLNIERNAAFDDDLINARQNLALKLGVEGGALNQKDVVYAAVHLLAYGVLPKLEGYSRKDTPCPQCNGAGHIAIKNGDDDVPCDACAQLDADMNSIPY